METLARSARFACWGNAWLDGHTSLDEADDRVRGTDAAHHVLGLGTHGVDWATAEPQPLLLAFGLLRRQRTTRFHLALPAPGDPVGLGGPRAFNEAALDAGEAVVCDGSGLGLVPRLIGSGVQWQVYDATTPPASSLPQAEAELTEALMAATETLVALDVPRWRPEAAAALAGLRIVGDGDDDGLAPGYTVRAERVAARARRCLMLCELALVDDGGAVTAHEIAARREALRPLERAARRGLVAACGDRP